jgi:hypothetical protein
MDVGRRRCCRGEAALEGKVRGQVGDDVGIEAAAKVVVAAGLQDLVAVRERCTFGPAHGDRLSPSLPSTIYGAKAEIFIGIRGISWRQMAAAQAVGGDGLGVRG